MSQKRLLLIDGNSIAFKAYFALPKTFTNKAGLHTNAIYGFHTMLDSVLARVEPTHILVAFDAGKTTFRTEMFQDYKGGRPTTDPELREQFLPLREMLAARSIRYYELPNYEADDIIGTLATRASEAGFLVTIVSGDRDMTQLATEKITVEISKKGVSDIEEYTPAVVQEKMGITPKQIIDLKGLMGDKSDNIPGVTKVGEKTALKLLWEYQTVEGVYEHIDELKASKMKENLINEQEIALLSKKLATINLTSPVEIELDELAMKEPDAEKLIAFYQENNFNEFLSRMGSAVEEEVQEISYEVVENFSAEHLANAEVFHLETFGENYHEAEVLAAVVGNKEKLFVTSNLDTLSSSEAKKWLDDRTKEKIVFDVKAISVFLSKMDLSIKGVKHDVLLSAYLLDKLDKTQEIAGVAKKLHTSPIKFNEDVYGKGAKYAVPMFFEEVESFAAQKAFATLNVSERLHEELEEKEMLHLLLEMEMPLAIVLSEMEEKGIAVKPEVLDELSVDLMSRIEELKTKIYAQAGVELNLNSPKQLGELLFETLGFDYKLYSKKTKTGYSTNAEVLEKMSVVAPIVDDILTYRELQKLQSTYIEGLKKSRRADGKIHTRYQQALTQTGRLSSVDPNLQNIPIRTEDGRKIRQAFVASKEDWVIYSSDYSQIELRVLAHISQDEHLKSAFMEGQDIHTSTAMRVFGISSPDEVTPLDRRNAKAVNFGVVYGISEWGLAKNLGIEPYKAKDFIDKYFEKYPGIKQYMEEVVREAKEVGYVETMFHRRRNLPEINERNFARRSFAERTAINSPIQGSAADILKIAMNNLHTRLAKENLQANLLLQVHDELIFEVAKSDVEALDKIVRSEMEDAVKLSVPLVADSAWGESWYDAK
ncbi:DNA polymerase I [Pilibacter termitis]|uniref:DNA polymerase I n=1 Tax=Pilibacter termitis TaxID=263852 RepID=A0A1T4NK67_9ENTE|nr:DNA polymerase I [Pilibacter termitis]SJZ79660.1 DNA polymerase I [Pilibacter termitis]